MKRDDVWSRSLPGSVVAWLFAAFFLFVALVFARLAPATLVVTTGTVGMAFLPRLRPFRTPTFWASLITWGLMLVPRLSSSAEWQTVPLCDAAALLAVEIAREEGLGVPLLRFFRSPKVQGWSTLVLFGPFAIGGILSTDDHLKRSGLPHEWRWWLLPLILLCLAPSKWVGGSSRWGWGLLPFLFGLYYGTVHRKEGAGEVVSEIARSPLYILLMAGWAHEGLAKIRPLRPDQGIAPEGPIRVHGGSGLA